jgi:type VI secretion system protein ImpC
MSTGESSQEQRAQSAEAQAAEADLLTQCVEATPVERDQAQDLIENLVQQAMQGVVKWDKNVVRTINNGIAAIDAAISKQLAAIMHHERFRQLEGTWRGLQTLVMNTTTGRDIRIQVFNCSKRELFKDLSQAVEFDQSELFKKIYTAEYDMPGGQPYGVMIGDYEFSNHPEDIDLLQNIAGVAAGAFCPFISSAAPGLFGFESWQDLPKVRSLEDIFLSQKYAKWNSFREHEDSRFVTLTLPRVMARLPYGEMTKKVDEFRFEEVERGPNGELVHVPSDQFCWMNAAYVFGTLLTFCFKWTGWCTRIRGAEGGGKVFGLPSYVFTTDDGDEEMQCPTEVAITERRENELSSLGFLPLCHYKRTDYAVFFGAQTAQKPKKYEGPDGVQATENAAISARLPYIMATSRIAHYLKVMARDKVGSFMERKDCEKWLNTWIQNYVLGNPKGTADDKARFPLAAAKIEVEDVPGDPGHYRATAFLRPWLQFEQLTASLRTVTKIPAKE